MTAQIITQEIIKELFEYRDGKLFWQIKPCSKVCIGDVAGFKTDDGYLSVGINKKQYKQHRLIFLYHYGYLPNMIDHTDGNKLNNNIENLRECTPSQNQYNSKIRSDSKSGIKGVVWSKRKNKWRARFIFNKIRVHVGYYYNILDAEKAILNARTKIHKEFANNG